MPCQKRPPTPGCQGPGKPAACNVCSKIKVGTRDELSGVLASKNVAKSKAYSRHVAQLCGGELPQWPTRYTLSTTATGSTLGVKVAINVTDGTGAATKSVRDRWNMMIGTVWNNKARISVPLYASATSSKIDDTVTRTVVFELEFVGATAGSPYAVTCNHTRTAKEYMDYFDALSAPERNNLIAAWRRQKPDLQAYAVTDPEWKKLKYLGDVTRDHNRHGTPHLGMWGDGDSEAIQHEFGHAIGLPDEYNTTKFWTSPDGNAWTEVAIDGSIYNQPPFSTKSLMNNTMSASGSIVFDRHFKLLAKDFENLVSTQLGLTGVVKPDTATITLT